MYKNGIVKTMARVTSEYSNMSFVVDDRYLSMYLMGNVLVRTVIVPGDALYLTKRMLYVCYRDMLTIVDVNALRDVSNDNYITTRQYVPYCKSISATDDDVSVIVNNNTLYRNVNETFIQMYSDGVAENMILSITIISITIMLLVSLLVFQQYK